MITQKVIPIEKEKIGSLTFPKEDVLKNKDLSLEIHDKIDQACSYGNIAQHKVKITFVDSESAKSVYTTIWELKNGLVYLKHNITIPINRIIGVVI